MLEIVTNVSFLISAITFFGLVILFGDSLLLRFEARTFLKAVGFLLLGIGSLINLFNHSYTQISIWVFIFGFFIIFVSLLLDPHSILKIILPSPLILIIFSRDHLFLFCLGILIAIAIFQLIYTTKHKDFIPLGVGFVLITAGEYLYSLEKMSNLASLAAAGAFLYLLASLVLLAWLWSYLALRFVYLFKPR